MSRVEDKIQQVEEYLNELDEIIPLSLEEYLCSLEKRLACERALEKIIESVNDLAILFIKEKRLKLPDEDSKAFSILAEKKFISEELCGKLRQAIGMRNFLVHQYEKIDNELVFETLSAQIVPDITEFLEILERLK